MAEAATASGFVLLPKGPFSLAASIRFLEGFAPAAHHAESTAKLEMAFCVDGHWDPVAVRVHEEASAVHGSILGGDALAPSVMAAAIAQVERVRIVHGMGMGVLRVSGCRTKACSVLSFSILV